MEELGIKIIYWLIQFTGAFAIVAGLMWLSLKLLTFILKSLGYWKDTISIMVLYYRIRRSDKRIIYRGRSYILEDLVNEK